MNKFKTIVEKEINAELVEKRSKFIASLFFVETTEEAEEKIKSVKKKYFDAKHNCSAYIINNNNQITKKSSDDGEPSGTAGAPMLEILDKQGIGNVVIVVTRYFGGILLGTGGLVRAYSDSLKLALEKATLVNLEHGYEISVSLNYADLENFKYYCNKNRIKILDYTYLDSVICKIELNEELKEILERDFSGRNNLNMKTFDIIRQKNVSVLSNNVN
ncbi:MAG: YigZ family protein [Clostridia bacterium]|nr:YigZ family protein [Clostridia bacterium]